MAAKLLTREEVIKLQEQREMKMNGPRWFLLSYDAGAEIREEKLNERQEKISVVVARTHTTDDFRKVVIRTLRKAKVAIMNEPAETTIFFQDPRLNMSVEDKLSFWENEFDDYGSDFYYAITASLQKDKGAPHYAERPDGILQKNFQKLLNEVLKEEEAKAKKKR